MYANLLSSGLVFFLGRMFEQSSEIGALNGWDRDETERAFSSKGSLRILSEAEGLSPVTEIRFKRLSAFCRGLIVSPKNSDAEVLAPGPLIWK